jgi:5,10-methylenetetrahydrofolate reductase
MRLHERLARRAFTTIVEVFPPTFSAQEAKEPLLGLRQKTRDVVSRVKKIENLADAILVADLKEPERLKLSSVFTAAVIKQELGVEAIPVITGRDMNKPAIRALVLTALAYDIHSLMLVWGDRFGDVDQAKNVYDYPSLSAQISDARTLANRADSKVTILAPVDISRLGTQHGLSIARSRLSAGADVLLAQPPTTDASKTLDEHLQVLDSHGLKSSVLLNVFPFRSREDIESCRTRFGWKIPTEMEAVAEKGEASLLRAAKAVVEGARDAKLSGVFVSTRGRPELARYMLD